LAGGTFGASAVRSPTLFSGSRWLALADRGAQVQRLLWASTGTKDPDASDTLYIEAFAAPFTVNTMPEPTLHAFADHGEVKELFPPDGGNAEQVLAELAEAGIDVAALAARLQEEGKESFNKSWEDLLGTIESQSGVKAG
jgi:transaldolase